MRNAVGATTAALDWTRTLKWATHNAFCSLELQWGDHSVATAATNPLGVNGYINFAGGAGGDPVRAPGKPCGVDVMEALMREFGRSTHVPGLWLYAQNDLYWGTETPHVARCLCAGWRNDTVTVRTHPFPVPTVTSCLRAAASWVGAHRQFAKQLGF